MPIPPLTRFMSLVAVQSDGCWLWQGHVVGSRSSYGRFRPTTSQHDPQVYAHRWSYEHFVGPIPDGLEVDHECRVPLCVNPKHLEAVTQEENNRRRRMLVCPQGHDLTVDANCTWDAAGRRRGCIVCRRERALARYYALKG